MQELENEYIQLIHPSVFLGTIIKDGKFEEWIKTNTCNSTAEYIKSLKKVKELLIEYEFYEQISLVDKLINKETLNLNAIYN